MLQKIGFYLLFIFWGSLIYIFFNAEANSSIFNLSFHYGELLKSLIENGKFEGYYLVNSNGVYLSFSAHRLPLIPYFITGVSKLIQSTDNNSIALIKNIIWQIPLAYSFGLLWKYEKLDKRLKIVALAFIFICPQIIKNSFTLGMEEGYIISLVGCFFGILLFEDQNSKSKYWKLIGILFICFWLKNTFMYIIPFLLVMVYFLTKKNKIVVIGFIAYLFCIFALMSFNKTNSGEFTLRYPFKYWNLYKGNNKATFDYYPKYSLDALDYNSPILQKGDVSNQWEFDDFYKKKYNEFVSENLSTVIWMDTKKLFYVLFDFRNSGGFTEEISFYHTIAVGFMFIFRIIQMIAIFLLLKLLFSKKQKTQDRLITFSALLFFAMYLAPYILGWGTERHISPLVLPVIYGALYGFSKLKPDFKSWQNNE